MLRDLGKRDVDLVGDEPENLCPVVLDPARTPVAPLRPRRDNARITPAANPFDGRRGRNPETLGRGATAQTGRNAINKTQAKIVGKRFGHAGRPPSPAHILNQNSSVRGIPSDSVRSEIALAEAMLDNAMLKDLNAKKW